MRVPREPIDTVTFIDEYCAVYRDLFPDVRSFEQFKLLHLGLIADLPRKSLPAISQAVGLHETQSLHHFVANSPWDVAALRQHRLAVTKQALRGRPFTLCIDETGDTKKGKTTDYVAHQYIGNVGKIANGIVSVNAYGVLDQVTFPLLFNIFKPRKRLHPTDVYQTKPHLARALIQELRATGFQIDLVLADCLYGESGDFITDLLQLKLPFVVAIRRNHGVWLGPGERVRFTQWRIFTREFSNGDTQVRYIREIIFGKRHVIRYYQLTTDPHHLPDQSTQLMMTNLTGNLRHRLGNLYGLRTWIEYGFKQAKNELGWADDRVTAYHDIERWWELVMSAYLMISLQTLVFNQHSVTSGATGAAYRQHRWWDPGQGWKHCLNTLRLLIQPYVCSCILAAWLCVFEVPRLHESLRQLVQVINQSQRYVPI